MFHQTEYKALHLDCIELKYTIWFLNNVINYMKKLTVSFKINKSAIDISES